MSETSKERVRESTEPTLETVPHVPDERPKEESPHVSKLPRGRPRTKKSAGLWRD
jgi:hypothetical protein